MKDVKTAVNKVENKVFLYMEEHNMVPPGEKLVLGVSGGADSVCLLFVLLQYRKRCPFSMAVVHVNHGIRPDAGEDAEYVRRLCRENDIPFHLKEADVVSLAREEKCSEEDAGRRLRYRTFAEAAEQMGWQDYKIAVAHNSSDRAETMLFHLFRGSGLKGLTGILPVRENVIRPILCLERAEIEEYLNLRGIGWQTDTTNDSDDYARNRIRHHIVSYVEKELFPGAVEHMNRTADLLAETEEYLRQQSLAALKQCVRTKELPESVGIQMQDTGSGEYDRILDVEQFISFPGILQKKILMMLMEFLSPTGKDIGYIHINDVLELFTRAGNRSINLPFGIEAKRQYGEVILWRKEEKSPANLPKAEYELFDVKKGQKVSTKKYTKWFDYDKIEQSLTIRFRCRGDYLAISDGNGKEIHKTVKQYMIDQKIPEHLRDRIPLVADGSHILWVIGYRISEHYKVDENTKRVLQIKIEETGEKMKTEEENG